MAFKQVVTPNLDPYIYENGVVLNDWMGWCLAYVKCAFNTEWAGSTATNCWNNYTYNKHADENIPQGVYVPIFFNGYGGFGHTVILKIEGGVYTMWSSPVTSKPYADIWTANSLAGIKSIIKNKYSSTCNYVGWAEGLRNTAVIVYEKDPDPAPALLPNQRQIGSVDLAWRSEPNSQSTLFDYFDARAIINLKGFVRGQSITRDGVTSDIWGVGQFSGGYMWLAGTTDGSTQGLADLTPTAPTPTPIPVPDKPYVFPKAFDFVTEVIPAAVGNFEYGNFPASPDGIVLHDFGTAGVNTYESVINTFKKKGIEISAHFIFSQNKITQMVATVDRAYHAVSGNKYYGFEIDPVYKNDPTQQANVRKTIGALQELNKKKLKLHKHPEFVATSCGDDIDLPIYEVPYPPPNPTPVPPTPTPVLPTSTKDTEQDERLSALEKLVKVITDFLSSIFSGFRK